MLCESFSGTNASVVSKNVKSITNDFLSCRSWDLNKICYKSGVPIIENVMIERVS